MTYHGVQLRPLGWRTPHLPVPPVIQQRPTVKGGHEKTAKFRVSRSREFLARQQPTIGSIPLELVLTKACEAAAVTPEMMRSEKRTRTYARAREIYAVIGRAYGWSYPQLAKFIEKDHVTLLVAYRRAMRRTVDRVMEVTNG